MLKGNFNMLEEQSQQTWEEYGFDKYLTKPLEISDGVNTPAYELSDTTVRGGQLIIGSQEKVIKADGLGLYVGASTFASAPFSVDIETGALIASSATINGYTLLSGGTFGGDGSDGDKTISTDTEWNDAYKTFQIDDLTVDITKTLSWGSNYQNKLVRLKIKGNLVMNGALDVSGLGGTGGAGGVVGPGANPGSAGTAGAFIWDALTHVGGGGGEGCGGGGASSKTIGTVGEGVSGGTAGAIINPFDAFFNQYTKSIFIACSSGGGGGGNNTSGPGNGVGGAGGTGGGALYIEVAGNVTFGVDSVITVAGDNGSNGTGSNQGGGGGGGAGGFLYFLYNGTLTDNGLAINIAGGTGGTGGVGIGDGGVGGNGDYILQKNYNFA